MTPLLGEVIGNDFRDSLPSDDQSFRRSSQRDRETGQGGHRRLYAQIAYDHECYG